MNSKALKRAIAAAPSGARGDDTRAALLAAGRQVFARRGYDGASVREIAAEAEANLGAITYHFGSKRKLYEKVLEEGLLPIVERVEEVAKGNGPPIERLGQVVEVFFEYLGAHPDLPRLLLQEISAGKRPPPAVLAMIRRNMGYVTSILSEGWTEGSLRRTDPLLSALSVVSQPIYMTLVGPILEEIGGIDLKDPSTRAGAIEHVQQLLRMGLVASVRADS